MLLLQDKVIFLTGGSAGIGLECAKAYGKAGARVVTMAPDPEEVARAIELLGEGHLGITGDVSRETDVEKAVSAALKQFGRIDAVHNNAGIATPSLPLHETDNEQWQRLMDVNLKSVLLTTRYCFETLKATRGCILHTSSLVGSIGQEAHAAYSATKGALNALTKSMALDYAPYGIRVNAVMPAAVWTPMLRSWNAEQKDPEVMADYLSRLHPLGYCPEGDVIADAAVFLLSDMARFITGCILPVSGGAELGYRLLH